MPEEEENLSFAEVGVPRRPDTALSDSSGPAIKSAPGVSDRGHWEKLEREIGLEPATLRLENRPDPKK